MTDLHSYSTGPSRTAIERPRCSECNNRMSLARIMPGPKGFDLRNFECARCVSVVTLTVATVPIKSDKVGWLAN